jgi:hypothetical protein
MRLLTDKGYIDNVAIILELTDTQLETVKNDRHYYLNTPLVKDLMKARGDNAHICGLFCTDNVIFKLKRLAEDNYKTVSWWDKDMQEFKITRR